jgi:multimeric flavodoxin WrbA
MKILLFNGSPRNGNTYKILLAIENSLKEKKYVTEFVNIKDFEINNCKGCYKCILEGNQNCPLKDDVNKIWGKFILADGIVLGVPVFALGIPGRMKNFMDRIAYNAHRPAFLNKPAIAISTTAGMGTEKVKKQLEWFNIAGLNIVGFKGFLTYPTGVNRKNTQEKIEKSLEKLAEKLDKRLKRKTTKNPTLIQLIQFYGLKMNAIYGKQVYKADYEYFKNKKYHIDVKINPIKLGIAKLFYKLGYTVLESKIDTK